MAYTAKDLYVNGLAKIGIPSTDGLLGESTPKTVYAVLTGAISEFYLTHEWDFLLTSTDITTVVGTAAYALPSNLDVVYGAYISALQSELKAVQTREAYKVGSAQATPRRYTVNNGYITLIPTPSTVLTVTVPYYKNIAHPNATDQGGSGLYTYLATISYATLLPEWVRGLAELYVAKHAAVALTDRSTYQLVIEQIAATRRTLDDNVRKSKDPVIPKTRADWNQ